MAGDVICTNTNSPDAVLAAAELEKHLALIFANQSTGYTFVVGERPVGEPLPRACESKAKVVGNKVYFWGEEGEHGLETSKGPLFAVYEFLDKALGVKWVFPGDDGIVVRPQKTLYAYRLANFKLLDEGFSGYLGTCWFTKYSGEVPLWKRAGML